MEEKSSRILYQQYFALLRLASGQSIDACLLTVQIDWNAIYDLSSKQATIGLIFAGIEKLPSEKLPPMVLLMDWAGQVECLRTTHGVHKEVILHVCSLLKNASIPHVFMKGLTCGARYPYPELRTCGDIDFVVDKRDFARTLDLLETVGSVDRNLVHEHHGMVHVNGVTLEPHYKVHNYQNSRNDSEMQRLFLEVFPHQLDSLILGGKDLPVYPKEFEGMFLISHMVNHVYEEGLGMRQVIDFYYWLRETVSIDKKLYEYYLQRMNMTRAARIFTRICEKYLGLPSNILGYTYSSREISFADEMMEDIMFVGNFAKTIRDSRNGNLSRHMFAYFWTTKRCIALGYLCPTEAYYWPLRKFYRFFDKIINPLKYQNI